MRLRSCSLSVCCRLRNANGINSSPNPKAREQEERMIEVPVQGQEKTDVLFHIDWQPSSPFVYLFVLFRPPAVWMMSTFTGEDYLLHSVHQPKCSSCPKTTSQTHKNLCLTWASYDPVKSTHRINHHVCQAPDIRKITYFQSVSANGWDQKFGDYLIST